MTDAEKIKVLQAALQKAYTYITQPVKSERCGLYKTITLVTYRNTAGQYNSLTSEMRRAMLVA